MIRNNYNLTLEDFVNILDAWAKLGDKDRDKVIILAEERKAHPTIYMPSEEYVEDERNAQWLNDPRGDMFINLTGRYAR